MTAPLLTHLDRAFQTKVKIILERVKLAGFELRPFFTLRDPWEQARLWRQSRSLEEINKGIEKLEREGAPWIASIIRSVGPCYGRWATNNMPGQSWHQYGLAVDCLVVSDNGRVVWMSNHAAYQLYAELAQKVGCTHGFYWKRRDVVHAQMKPDAVRAYYTWSEIDQFMKERFDGDARTGGTGPNQESIVGNERTAELVPRP